MAPDKALNVREYNDHRWSSVHFAAAFGSADVVADLRARARSHRPLVLLPLVKRLHRTLRGLGLEIRHDVAETQLRVGDGLLGVAARDERVSRY